MGKSTKEIDSASEDTVGVFLTNQISVDEDNGIVVFATTAPDGTAFTVLVNDQPIEGVTEAGQVWFYAGASIGANPVISLQ